MTRILATNGRFTRLMGTAELKAMSDTWYPVTEATKAAHHEAKEVKTPAPPVVVPVAPVHVATPDHKEHLPIPTMIAKIKEAKTAEEVNAIVEGEERKTVLNVATAHIKRLA